MIDLSNMTTEQQNEKSMNFSGCSIKEAIEIMNHDDICAVEGIQPQFAMIERVVEITSNALQQGGRIIYMGAGTSGRLGILDAVECVPTFGVGFNTVVGLMAGGETAFIQAKEGVEDLHDIAIEDLKNINVTKDDVVIGIAASGRTPYVISGLQYAQSIGSKTCAIVCNLNSEISKLCPLTIEVETGPEVLTGSTRLKAGTVTKLVLNMISTISMNRIGKIYKNYMVDLKLTNEKLVTRGINIVSAICECSKEHAKEVLEQSNQNVKQAIVMILLSCSLQDAKVALHQAHDNIENIKR